MILTTNKLLEKVRIKAAITPGQAGLSSDDILGLATDVMVGELLQLIKTRFEGYFLYTEEIPLVAGKDRYRVPDRALWGALNHLYLKRSDGGRTDLSAWTQSDMARLPSTPQNRPTGYTFEANSIRLIPSVGDNPTDTLVAVYYFRPNRLVLESNARKVVASSANTITLPSLPIGWSTADRFDIINHRSGSEIIAYSLTPLDISGNVVTFAEDLTAFDIQVGNWVCREGESVVPMIPEDCHDLLAEMTVGKIAEIRNDETRKKLAENRIKELKQNMLEGVSQRVSTKPDVIVGRNPFLTGRSASSRRSFL